MGKLINEPIFFASPPAPLSFQERGRKAGVQTCEHTIPCRFTWRGKNYRIETIGGEWRTLGRWWEGEGERRYLRAVMPGGLTMDLCQDMKTGNWMLHELQD